jgi:hypothetical protein
MKQFLIIFLFTIISLRGHAQQNDSIPCPKIQIEGPSLNQVPAGEPAVLVLKPFKKKYEKTHDITYHWMATNGTITDGGESRIVHISTKGLSGQQITAAVVIGGLEPGCLSTASIILDVVQARTRTEDKIIIGKKAPSIYRN